MDTYIDPFYDESDLGEAQVDEDALSQPVACPTWPRSSRPADRFSGCWVIATALGRARSTWRKQIAALLRQPGHALIEAGTGIGKSFAYLIPAIWSGTPAVVSTSNKALMAQLWHKDVPALQEIAPRPIRAVIIKGRSNYLCALRMRELSPRQKKLSGLGGDLERVQEGLARVPSGDVEEMGLPAAVAANLTVDFRGCEGRKCPEFHSCFFERARTAAQQADLVITNHAVLCFSALAAGKRATAGAASADSG